jgi:PAS domain S-box-containing protein
MDHQAAQVRQTVGGLDEDATVREILEGTAQTTGGRFFAALVEALAKALGTYSAWVTEYLPAARRLHALAFWADGRLIEDFFLDIAGTPCEGVIDSARLVHYPDQILDLFPGDGMLRDFSAVSYMGVPLLDASGSVIGNLAVMDNRPMPQEPRSELLFRLFAARAAAELQRVQAEADIRKREEKYRRIVEAAGEGFILTDTQWTITDVNAAFCRLVGARREDIVGRRPVDFAAEEHKRFLVDNRKEIFAGRYPEFESRLVSATGRSILVLVHGNSLCDDAGAVLGYMAFITDMREHKKSLILAGEVQKSLLPKKNLRVDGLDIAGRTVACEEIGGDYYDFMHGRACPDAPFEAVVGDVTGHGVDAALLMMTARGFLRMRASQCGRISQIVNELNRHLAADFSNTGRFMTLFYLSVDPRARTLRWVRAGHDPALLYDSAGDRFEELGGRGMALGVDPAYRYQEGLKTGLASGQLVAVGTDGIWETRDRDGRMFGKERFREVLRRHAHLPAEAVVDAVHDALNRFAGGVRPADDTTLVVVKMVDFPVSDFQI